MIYKEKTVLVLFFFIIIFIIIISIEKLKSSGSANALNGPPEEYDRKIKTQRR